MSYMCCIVAGGISLRPTVSCACAIRVGQNDGGHSAQPTQALAPAAPAPAAQALGAAYLAAPAVPAPDAQLPNEAGPAGAQDQTYMGWADHRSPAERAGASADSAADPHRAQLAADLQHPPARDTRDLQAPVLLNRTLARRIRVLPALASRDLLHNRAHRNQAQAASSAADASCARRRR